MKRRLLFTLLVLGIAATCFAAVSGITGKWTGMIDFGSGDNPIAYNFTADGAKLTGSVDAMGATYKITDGVIKGDSLLFNVDYNGDSIPNKGKCYADSIGLNIDAHGQVVHVQLKRAQ